MLRGSPPPPPLFPNPAQPVFRLPTTPISGETPHRPVASDEGVQHLQEALSFTNQAIASLRASGIRPLQSLLDSASSLARKLQDTRLSSSRPGVSSSAKPRSPQVGPTRPETTQMGPDRLESTPVGPGRPEFDPAVPGPSRRRSFDSPQRSSDHSSRQGSHTPPRKRRRRSGNSSDEDPSSQNRQQRDVQQDEEDNFRPASLDLLLNYITKKFPAASQPLVQPSSKRFHIMKSAGLVDESSQQSSNLAWFAHMRSACDSAQRKFEAKVSEGKSLSSMLTSVSRTERVTYSPCQGRATKINSQVFDLMPSRPAESRSVPLSVREATTLETALRGVMESYNFQLWTVTALFRFLGDSGCCPMDDPLLDQFQRSFSRGAENVTAALASTTAFVSAKRRESFLSHMFPSVTDAQKRKLLSDPLFDQKDLFAPASIEGAREAPRDFSLYRGAQSRPPMSSGSNQRRQFNSSNPRGRQFVSSVHIASLSGIIFFFRALPAEEETLRSPQETWGFSEVGACSLTQHRRLSRPVLASLDGSGSGCLGRGGLARGIQDPILSETSLIRPTSPHALLFPVVHQGKSLGEGVPRSSPQGSYRTGSSDSRLLQSPIRGPEGLWVLATHHRPVDPEHIHRVTTLPYGDSSVRPALHSPRRLDDLIGSSGRLPSGSNPPGIASVSSLHYGRSSIPVQGTMLRANNCPSGLYKAHGSNIRHSPSLRYQDPPISRRLVDSSRIQDHLYSNEGQAPASV